MAVLTFSIGQRRLERSTITVLQRKKEKKTKKKKARRCPTLSRIRNGDKVGASAILYVSTRHQEERYFACVARFPRGKRRRSLPEAVTVGGRRVSSFVAIIGTSGEI